MRQNRLVLTKIELNSPKLIRLPNEECQRLGCYLLDQSAYEMTPGICFLSRLIGQDVEAKQATQYALEARMIFVRY